MPGYGGQVDHVPAVLLPLVYLEGIQRCQGHKASVVDQDIDTTKLFLGRCRQAFYLFESNNSDQALVSSSSSVG